MRNPKTMKNIAEDTAVIKKIIVWTNERDDVLAHHHRHWLLSEPTAWKDLLQMMSQRLFTPIIASRNLSCGKQEAWEAIRVETGCKNVYLVVLLPVRHPHSRL
jgi:hypothetical protein